MSCSDESKFQICAILISDPPIVTLRLGSTLLVDDIKESDDIYFECDIKANPPWRKLSWLHDVSDGARSSGHAWWIALFSWIMFYDEIIFYLHLSRLTWGHCLILFNLIRSRYYCILMLNVECEVTTISFTKFNAIISKAIFAFIG